MATITINGKIIHVEGNASISVSNDEVRIGGKVVESGLSGIVEVKWEGPLASLTADGDVTCKDVQGNVSAGGDLRAEVVRGNANAGGDIRAGTISGSVRAGGDVIRSYGD